jgi:hypothetical protein
MGKSVIFRLTTGKKDGTWSIRGGSATKDGTKKFINYYPGCDSIFDEDNKKSIVKPQTVTFKYNDVSSDPGVEVVADVDDTNLIAYLKAHPFYGVHYKIHDEEELDKEKSANYDKISEAFSLIQESDDVKIQAIAIAILGMQAYGWSPAKCSATLKETATKNPDAIISKANSESYESFLLSALAFGVGIVKEDATGNEVVWNDNTKGVILRLAKGENGIEKLGDMLFDSDNKTVLQEIGIRLKKYEKTTNENAFVAEDLIAAKAVVDNQAKQIEELKAALATANSKPDMEVAKKIEVIDTVIVAPVKLTLEEAQKAYIEQEKKDPPVNVKNNLDWILSKLHK